MEPNTNEVVNQEASPVIPPSVVNPDNKPKKSHKVLFFLLGIFIVLILIGGIAGGYYFGRSSVFNELTQVVPSIPPKDPDMYKGSPTPEAITDETADWKTYESNCGILVKLPYSWSADNKFFASDKDVCINIGDENFKTGSGDAISGFYINIHRRMFDTTKYKSLEEYVKDYEMEGIPFNYSPKKYASFSGFEFDPPGRGDNRSFMFIKDNYIYEVNWIISTSNPYTNIIPQVISSIKFTD